MKLIWLEQLRKHPIDWDVWSGRRTSLQSSWVSDCKIAVLRAASDSKRILRVEDAEDSEPWRSAGKTGKDIRRIIDTLPDERHLAEWIGAWRGDGDTIVTLGDPDYASYFVNRLRLLHLLCGFDEAFWYEGTREYGFDQAAPHPVTAWKRGAVVGLLMPINTNMSTVPEDIRDAYAKVLAA